MQRRKAAFCFLLVYSLLLKSLLGDYLLVRLTISLNLRTISRKKGRAIMQPDFRVESRSYDQVIRGSWQAYRLDATVQLSDESAAEQRAIVYGSGCPQARRC